MPQPQVTAFAVQVRTNKPCLHQPLCPLGKGLRKRVQNLTKLKLFLAGLYKRVFSPAPGQPGFPATGLEIFSLVN